MKALSKRAVNSNCYWERKKGRRGSEREREVLKGDKMFLNQTMLLFFFVCLFFVFCHFRGTPAAYGGPQARGPIRAVASGLHQSHSMPDLRCMYNLHYSSWQCWILNPLSEARDRTRNLMVPSLIHFCCTTMETPVMLLLIQNVNQVILKALTTLERKFC